MGNLPRSGRKKKGKVQMNAIKKKYGGFANEQ